jgi:hypothetical protein
MPLKPLRAAMGDDAALPPPPPPMSAVAPPPATRPRFRLPWEPGVTIAVVAIAVVLLLLLSLALSGGPGSSAGAAGSGTAIPFSSARNVGTQAGAPHGTWDLYGGIGLDLANATSLPLDLSAGSNCTVTSFSGPLPSSLTIPAFAGNLTSGAASEWLFSFLQPGTGNELAVAVTNGAANLVVELSGPSCTALNASSPSIPDTIVDSTTAASAVAAAGATAYLRAHPTGVTLEMLLLPTNLVGAHPASSPYWAFLYSTCAIDLNGTRPSGPLGYTFSAGVNASSGEVVPQSPTTGTCDGPPPVSISSALSLGAPTLTQGAGTGGTLSSQGCVSRDYCYSLPVASASHNISPAEFQMEVLGNNGPNETLYPSVGFAILNAAGQVVVYATGPFEEVWTSGVGSPNTLVSSTMTVSVDMGTTNPTLGGYFLAITGTGPFADSEESYGL